MTGPDESRHGERLASLEAGLQAVNRRVDDNNADTKRDLDELREEKARLDRMDARIDRLFYVMIGVGAAVIATLVTGQVVG